MLCCATTVEAVGREAVVLVETGREHESASLELQEAPEVKPEPRTRDASNDVAAEAAQPVKASALETGKKEVHGTNLELGKREAHTTAVKKSVSTTFGDDSADPSSVKQGGKGQQREASVSSSFADEFANLISAKQQGDQEVQAKSAMSRMQVEFDKFLNASRLPLRALILYTILRGVLPILCNGLWVALANVSNCGGSEQNFWIFLFEYDLYYVALKAVMITLYYRCFMPEPAPRQRSRTFQLHCLLVFLMCALNVAIGLIWRALELHDEGIVSWLIFKLNFPVSATLAFVSWAPFYLLGNWQTKSDRLKALKRYVLLVVVLVLDVMFIASSHAYIFLCMHVNKSVLTEETDFFVAKAIQIPLIIGFTMVYMPIVGRIWFMGIFLLDRLSPMEDLQYQRFVYFATVICDMHRMMYSRELFSKQGSLLVFYLILVKDFAYFLYQFILKADARYQLVLFGVFHKGGFKPKNRFVRNVMYFLRRWDPNEAPKSLMSWHRVYVDAGFVGDDEHPSDEIRFFINDMLVIVYNMPSAFAGKFAALRDLPAEGRKQCINQWIEQIGARIIDDVAKDGDFHRRQRGKDSCFEWLCASEAVHGMQEAPAASSGCGGGLPWECEFYEYIRFRLNGLIFQRAQARITVGLATAFSYLFMGLIIHGTESRRVLNFTQDHTVAVPMYTIIVGLSFFVSDVAQLVTLNWYYLKNVVHRKFYLKKFGRLGNQFNLAMMVLICTVCCNSDFYFTYPIMKFCGSS